MELTEGRYQRARERTYEILEVAAPGDTPSKVVNLSIIALVLLNAAAFGLEFLAYFAPYQRYLRWFEFFSVAVFSLEYVLRLWSCTASPAVVGPVFGRLRFALHPLILIDLLAILPFYLPMLVRLDLRVLRLLRLMRLVRLVKLTRYLQQPLAKEQSFRELIDRFRGELARICGQLAAGRDRDLTRIRERIDDAIGQIRQQTWLSRRQFVQFDEEMRRILTAPIDNLEAGLIDAGHFREIQSPRGHFATY